MGREQRLSASFHTRAGRSKRHRDRPAEIPSPGGLHYTQVNFEDTSSSQLALGFDSDRRRKRLATWRVSQLVAEARELVEESLGEVSVEGEISNLRPASSGHLYFTLKDADAQLPVVLFRRQALLLRFRPEDGLQVRARGKVSVYEQRGQLQLVAETLEPVGAGSLQLAFEQLRDRLKAEGLFEASRKRPLPAFPRTVAVITSPTGAVIRDFLNIVSRRHAGLNVLVIPVAVQGDGAASEIEAALRAANDLSLDPHRPVDAIVLARGGGSLEDMAAFNSERVARAIVASALPVVSAIGHETDFTIADFVADLRAPTPSAAAELITGALFGVAEQVGELRRRLDRAIRFRLLQARQQWSRVPIARAEQRMAAALHRRQQKLDDATGRLDQAMRQRVGQHRDLLMALTQRILRQDPRHRLGHIKERLASLRVRLDSAADRRLQATGFRLDAAEKRLFRAGPTHLAAARFEHDSLRLRLDALSPLAVLERGYALVEDEAGGVVRDAARLAPGQRLKTRLGRGSFQSQVGQIVLHSEEPGMNSER